jgi:ubiquinone/menaquinone biosynthesis C-methylase UbiE
MQETREAHIPTDAEPSQVEFRVGDACNLASNLAPVDALLAANLICRLPEPRKFLNALPRIVKPGGIVVLTTPFSWLEAWTKQRSWLGG